MSQSTHETSAARGARHLEILRLLAALRGAHEHMEAIFLRGSCYELYLILRVIHPDAEPWLREGHVYTRIDGRFYDIRGQALLSAAEQRKTRPGFVRTQRPHRWRDRGAERARGMKPRLRPAIEPTWQIRTWQAVYRTARRWQTLLWPLERWWQTALAIGRAGEHRLPPVSLGQPSRQPRGGTLTTTGDDCRKQK